MNTKNPSPVQRALTSKSTGSVGVGSLTQTCGENESHSIGSNSLQPHIQSTEFSRPEYWSGWPIPSSANLPDPGIEPGGLLHCRRILYPLTYEGSCGQGGPPKTLPTQWSAKTNTPTHPVKRYLQQQGHSRPTRRSEGSYSAYIIDHISSFWLWH